MPLPPAAIPLCLLHPLHPNPASAYAARAGASSLLAAALARDLYRRTPEWIRQDDLCRSLLESQEGDNKDGHVDEMASLTAVIQKLQGLIVTGYEKLGSERRRMRRKKAARSGASVRGKRLMKKSTSECLCQDGSSCEFCKCQLEDGNVNSSIADSVSDDVITPLEWHAALLAYIQLSNQIRERYPQFRDGMYESDRTTSDCNYEHKDLQDMNASVNPESNIREPSHLNQMQRNSPITASEIKELKQMLDYAVYAYEPDEEVLRKWLLGNHTDEAKINNTDSANTGYQLLVHRTTSYIEPFAETINQTVSKSKSPKKLRKPPGRVGYYVAISHSKKEVLIGMKGTSTLEDILTDCCGRALRLDLENDPHHPTVMDCEALLQTDAESNSVKGEDVDSHESESQNDYVVEYENDEILHVSMISGSNDPSSPDEIEVNLVELEEFHHDEEIQIQTRNTSESAMSPSKTSKQLNNPKRKGSGVNLSTLSAPPPAENILLVPTNQKNSAAARSDSRDNFAHLHDELTESDGIEMQPERTTKVRGVHEGLLHCAQQLFSEISPLIEEFAVSKGYDVVCTGHSMGAGTSSLLALLIRGKYPQLVVPNGDVERVRVYAFAPPPVMDRATSLACQHYVTSIVNNSDIIPRSSLTNLDVLLTMLEAVRNRLVDMDMNPGGRLCQNPKSIITSLVALFQKLAEGADGELLIEPAELLQVFDEAVEDALLGEDGIYWDEEGDHHLFVPGNVLMLYEPWLSERSGDLEATEPDADDRIKDDSLQYKETEADSIPRFHTLWTNGTAPMLKGFEVGAGSGIVTDHLTSSYYRALDAIENVLLLSNLNIDT